MASGGTSQLSQNSIKLPNYFTVTADFTSATWNTVATHEIATVTGMVHMIIIPECTQNIAGGGTIEYGTEINTDAFAGTITGTDIDVGDLISSGIGGLVEFLTPANIIDVSYGGGLDVGYEIKTSAFTGGTIIHHIWWEPLSSTGSVAAGVGGAL